MDLSRAALARYGITRLGDLTDLDRAGIPVWFACRPDARSLSVSQGKGMTAKDAQLSAVMESLEYRAAERHEDLDLIEAAAEELGERAIDLSRLSCFLSGNFDRRLRRKWLAGRSLVTGADVFAPYEAVGLDMRIDGPWDSAGFVMHSVGLAAHFERDAAVRHALFEVIENDATQLVDIFGSSRKLAEPVDVAGCADESIVQLAEAISRAGLAVRLFAIDHLSGLPVIGAHVYEAGGGKVHGGYACRSTPEAAASAAILEALQSRITDIAAARDDIDPRDLVSVDHRPPPTLPGARELAQLSRLAADCDLVACARAAGAVDIVVFDLATLDRHGYAAVRVLCPGLGHAPESGDQVSLGVSAVKMLLAGAKRR